MVSITIQGANLFAPQSNENEEGFLRRMGFYEQCTRWVHEFEHTMLTKNVPGGMSSLSVQFSSNYFPSHTFASVAEFRWRNLTFCALWFNSETNEIVLPWSWVGITRLRFESSKQEPQFNCVKMLSGFLIEVVKNELSKLEKLRDALGAEAFPR